LRDQFVVGASKKRNYEEETPSQDRKFEEALKLAQADELAERESKTLQTSAARPCCQQAKKSKPHYQNKQQLSPDF